MSPGTKKTLSIFWQHAAKYKLLMIVIFIAIILGTIGDIYKPFLYKALFDQLATPNSANQDPQTIILYILAINVFSWFMIRVAGFSNAYFQSSVMAALSNNSFRYLIGHSFSFFNNNFTGSLVRRINRFSDAFEHVADQLTWNLMRTFLGIGAILVVLAINYWQIALIVGIWGTIFISINYWFANFKMKYNLESSAADSKATGYLSDVISNSFNVKIFSSKNLEVKSFAELMKYWAKMRRFSWNLDTAAEAVQGAFMIVLEFLVIWYALKLWRAGSLTIGDFALLQAYLIQIFDRLWDVGRNIQRIYRYLADADEMTEILNTEHGIQDRPLAKKLVVPEGAIRFNNVSFQYNPDRPIFRNLSLNIEAHQKVALIGPSGGGKSTIVKLLFRFFNIQEGNILIDGQDIVAVTQDSLRDQIALVPQEPILFHRSLLENIRYAKPDATTEEVIAAAKLAHCHEFISRFPQKYQTFVGERGVKLSGGERQRVAIARAILKDAPILVLDEATSSLDSESERFIQDALANLMRHKTTLVIAHRLSTIMQMDRIIVLEKGMITEDGNHDELLKVEQGTYQKLWEIQAGGY